MSLEIAKLPLVQSLIQEYGFTNCDFSEIIFEKICKENSIDVYSVPPEDKRLCLESLNKFKSKAKQFYQENFRMLPRLLEKKKEWIAKPLVLPLQVGNRHKTFEKRGRPSTEWMEASARTKRRMTSALAEEDEALLASAAARAVRGNTCKKDFAFLMKEAVASPNRPSKIKKAVSISPPVKYSTEETIALMIRLDLSIREYKILKASLSQHKVKVFPSLREIAKERRNCYTENIIVSETKAECPLGSLLAHTSSRLLKVAENKIFSLFSSKTDLTLNATLHCKCGFDGASSQSIYKQKFDLCDDSLDEALKNQENLFSTCIVPLQLVIEDNIVWNNLVPSSIRFCRPIRIQYVKETPEICRSERDYLVTQLASIEKCTLHHITINNRQFKIKVKHEVVITMLDGKAVNALTNTSSTQTCNICGAKPSEMNNLHLVSLKDVEETHLHYGLSTLHCWIRFFEFILHLGYKLDIQKGQARTQEEKESVKRRKSKIQKDFKLTLGLTVDQPKVGSGNTNDGNTARKAFKNFEKMAEITGIKEDFVKRLYVILQVIASNQEIDCGNFNQYCLLTAKMFCRNYSWFKMPPSLHKVLIHGADVIQSQILPIGFYSEEAQECMNKYVRTARLHHSRKTSREETIMDQIRHLLILSDPLISSQKDSVKKQRPQTMTPEALSLLKQRFDDLNLSSSDEEEED